MNAARSPKRELAFQITDVARLLRTYIDHRAREHGMTRAQWAVLVRLQRHEGITQIELAAALELQPITLTRLLDRLCCQGLIERTRHPSDRRANRVHLTKSGHATLDSLSTPCR
jgi:MarR family transcriptional regulator for hemolysin